MKRRRTFVAAAGAICGAIVGCSPLSASAAGNDDDATGESDRERGIELGAAGAMYGVPVTSEVGVTSLAFLGGGVRAAFPIAAGRARLGVIGEGFRSIEGLYGGAGGAEVVVMRRFGILGLGVGAEAHWLMIGRNTSRELMSFLLVGGQGVLQIDLARLGNSALVFDLRPRLDVYWLGVIYGATAGFAIRMP